MEPLPGGDTRGGVVALVSGHQRRLQLSRKAPSSLRSRVAQEAPRGHRGWSGAPRWTHRLQDAREDLLPRVACRFDRQRWGRLRASGGVAAR